MDPSLLRDIDRQPDGGPLGLGVHKRGGQGVGSPSRRFGDLDLASRLVVAREPRGGIDAFLLPAVGKKPAAALVAKKKGERPAPEIKLQTAPVEGGYSMQALIPLTSLGLKKDQKEMNLEFLIGVAASSKGGKMLYKNHFDSVHAYQNNTRYQPFKVEE